MARTEISEKTKARKKYFMFVRDIPYHIAVETEQDYSCATKPIILEKLLTSLGLKCQRTLCTFKWKSLKPPKRILNIPHDDVDTHEFLKVFVPETKRWVQVDPNWDSRIHNSNLPIAEWDGINNTKIAVPIIKLYPKDEGKRISAEEDFPLIRKQYLDRNRAFFKAINRWVDSQRL